MNRRGFLALAMSGGAAVALAGSARAAGLVDDLVQELRSQGFIPHCFHAVKRWPIAPLAIGSDPRKPLNQLLEADLVYVRDFSRPESLSIEQLKHLALIAHHCYNSFDLAMRCVMLLEQRQALESGAQQSYLQMLMTAGK